MSASTDAHSIILGNFDDLPESFTPPPEPLKHINSPSAYDSSSPQSSPRTTPTFDVIKTSMNSQIHAIDDDIELLLQQHQEGHQSGYSAFEEGFIQALVDQLSIARRTIQVLKRQLPLETTNDQYVITPQVIRSARFQARKSVELPGQSI